MSSEELPDGDGDDAGAADASSIRFDLMDEIARDRRAGRHHGPDHYLAHYPGHEQTIAEELERQGLGGEATPATPRARRPEPPLALPQEFPDLRKRLDELARPVSRGTRFVKEAVLGQGGMGIVHRVRDLELDRILALKEIRLGPAQTSPITAARFLEEAQVTAQLDHPGIVSVHEVGVDAGGHLYFAMKLVRGRDLKAILDQPEDADGWNLPRTLTVLARVCEAMSYAHSKGVIHRDLKPANIMVGNYGEVYVMDWGLARVLGRPDLHDLRPKNDFSSASVHTLRRNPDDDEHESPLVTMDGIALGTPSYMAPEQARGELEQLSPCSDVYSIGAILYHALTGQAPYVPRGARVPAERILWRLIEGPPVPVTRLRAGIPAELVAIQERAMARDPAARYRDTGELAADLQAYLEQRVVRAYQTGALAELVKWTQRNRPLAAALIALVVLLGAGLALTLGLKRDSDHNRVLAQERLVVAKRQSDELFRLATFQRLDDLERRADVLWPAVPELLPAYDAWIEEARALVAELEPGADGLYLGHRAKALELASRARPQTALELEQSRQVHEEALAGMRRAAGLAAGAGSNFPAPERLEREIEELQTALGASAQQRLELAGMRADLGGLHFDDPVDRWWHAQLCILVARLEALADPVHGLLDGISEEHGWGVGRRRAFVASLEERSRSGAEARRLWSAALSSIADPVECPAYAGLVLTPQLGLLPIGRDPDSGLWEFAELSTGTPATRDGEGKLRIEEETGLVLVLLPGGSFDMGAQSRSTHEPNFDPEALDMEGPVHRVSLSPCFLSKFEMTQAQWLRAAGRNPSHNDPETYELRWSKDGRGGSLLHPVEGVSWWDCERLLARFGLVLPTEAQWEYATRAGSSTPWWFGSDARELGYVGNHFDAFAAVASGQVVNEAVLGASDDYVSHAPVGSFAPNAFGLHDVHGNVLEWCRDGLCPDMYLRGDSVDPLCVAEGDHRRMFRGGSYERKPRYARSSNRVDQAPEYVSGALGVRPARAVVPGPVAAEEEPR